MKNNRNYTNFKYDLTPKYGVFRVILPTEYRGKKHPKVDEVSIFCEQFYLELTDYIKLPESEKDKHRIVTDPPIYDLKDKDKIITLKSIYPDESFYEKGTITSMVKRAKELGIRVALVFRGEFISDSVGTEEKLKGHDVTVLVNEPITDQFTDENFIEDMKKKYVNKKLKIGSKKVGKYHKSDIKVI